MWSQWSADKLACNKQCTQIKIPLPESLQLLVFFFPWIACQEKVHETCFSAALKLYPHPVALISSSNGARLL